MQPQPEDVALAYGTLRTSAALAALPGVPESLRSAAEVRQSSHYAGGSYVLLRQGLSRITLEQAEPGEYLLRGESESVENLASVCGLIAESLRLSGTSHRIEVYTAAEELHVAFSSEA